MAARSTPTTVEVNGFAAREIRIRSGIEIAPLAELVGVTRAHLANVELGHRHRMSASTFTALLSGLGITDRRALLAKPHPDKAEDAA